MTTTKRGVGARLWGSWRSTDSSLAPEHYRNRTPVTGVHAGQGRHERDAPRTPFSCLKCTA